jgi:uncharacterized membrane protein
MKTEIRGQTLAVAALAVVSGLLLANRMRKARELDMDMVAVPIRESITAAPTKDSLILRMPSGTAVSGTAVASVSALLAGGLLVSLLAKRMRESPTTSSIDESIELNVPVSTAYNQWTQFEEFPKFMASVEEVKQVDNTHLHWRAKVAGKPKEWDAEITEQIPDARIAWRSTSGVHNEGFVTFHKLGDNKSKVMLHMDYDPQTFGERVADALGGVKLATKSNLKRFKHLVEGRGMETGAWRGAVARH